MRTDCKVFTLIVAMMLACAPALARQGEPPPSLLASAKRGSAIPRIELAPIDAAALRAQADARIARTADSEFSKRLAVALGNDVVVDPLSDGIWQTLEDGAMVWTVAVRVEGATDMHLGFERYALPSGAALWVTGSDDYYEGPYTAADPGPLWVPMVPGDTATIEIRLPDAESVDALQIALTHVGAGFRDLFKQVAGTGPGASGACNINVICPLGQPYANEYRALAYYEFRADDDGLTYICTGTLLNTVAGDRRNYVLTAAHCLASPTEATSMRVYWNYRSNQCAATSGWSLSQNQTGASLRATRADADFTLVELNSAPQAGWQIYYAGWDAGGIAPSSSIGLHHPAGDVAKVTLSNAAPRTTSNCIGTGGGSVSSHWLSGPYAQGTTEGGSSGSGLWIPATDGSGRGKRLIGVLSGGNAACSTVNPSQPDNGFDCYGKFSAAWDGASAASRLRDWLDPAASGTLTVAGLDPGTPVVTIDPGLASRIAAQRQVPSNRAARSAASNPLPFDPRTRRTQ